ncbi:MAG: M61 family peptidase [Vicinamibacterales bacterium]
MAVRRVLLFVVLLLGGVPTIAAPQTSTYRLTFPDVARRSMRVELTLVDVPSGGLELHMSRSSPGRYAAHDFARNVSDVEVADASGVALDVSHPTPQVWRIERPSAQVRVRYRVSGERTDGTYLGIDPAHAHINMPAALLWARGFEDHPFVVRFDPPEGSGWRVATQLFPGDDAWTFTAPNLQYLMDSPTELSAFTVRTFTVADTGRSATVRLAVHHTGDERDVDALTVDAERIVREARGVFGELPTFDAGTYTFIADYLPGVVPDGMEHRNSTVVTSRGTIRDDRPGLLEALSHEFFHVWNVERIRPRSLEPFDFDAVNPSGELWLAEGFTQYYGALVLARAELITTNGFAGEVGGMVRDVVASPARQVRTLEGMSRLATLVDGAAVADVAGVRSTFLSYYTWGGAVALGLDLTLRDRTGGRVTLDTFMRQLWERHGRPGGRAPGYVDRPYTTDDLKETLASLVDDRAFADEFFARYIQGREVIDYDRLLSLAGFVWRAGLRGGEVLVPAEEAGRGLTDAQRAFRAAWLSSHAR